jgi:DtxR family transcriptional regulator, Mn-dependent transcriptional regulator
MVSITEENYLKAIFKISEKEETSASTNAISAHMSTSAASVSDMIKRLADKDLVLYEKWKGVRLTEKGRQIATSLIRKHRLWEVFLVDKLSFAWDEVHPLAEELEHIQSDILINRLDEFLGFPKFDPHGDPIPDKEGNFTFRKQVLLSDFIGKEAVIVGVQEHSKVFLNYLDRLGLKLGTAIEILEKVEYDGSLAIKIENRVEQTISGKIAQNLFVR